MNKLLDFVVCGPGAHLCGGIKDLVQGGGPEADNNNNAWDDFKFWDALTKQNGMGHIPPIPSIVEVSCSDSDDHSVNDDVSMLSELELAKAYKGYARYRDILWEKEEQDCKELTDLQLLEMELEEAEKQSPEKENDGSLACSSFDSRIAARKQWDDGSSYSSFYFRLMPEPRATPKNAANNSSALFPPETSFQTTSTRSTQATQNLTRKVKK